MGVSFAGLNAPYDIIIGLPTSFCENESQRPCICCRKVGLPGACAGSNLSTWLGHRHLLVGGPIRGALGRRQPTGRFAFLLLPRLEAQSGARAAVSCPDST